MSEYKVQIHVGGEGGEWLDLGHAAATTEPSAALLDYEYALRFVKPEVAVRLVRQHSSGFWATELASVPMAAGRDVPIGQLQRLAQKAGFGSAINVGSDREDFRELSAATLHDLLVRAYLLGRDRAR